MEKEIDCRLKRNRDLKSCKGKQLIVEKAKKKPEKVGQGIMQIASLFVGLVSLAITVGTIVLRPAPIPIESLSLFSGNGVLYIPIAVIFGIITIISFTVFFIRRKNR